MPSCFGVITPILAITVPGALKNTLVHSKTKLEHSKTKLVHSKGNLVHSKGKLALANRICFFYCLLIGSHAPRLHLFWRRRWVHSKSNLVHSSHLDIMYCFVILFLSTLELDKVVGIHVNLNNCSGFFPQKA